MNRTELRKQVLSLPMNSILYIDVPKEDGAKLCLERIKLSALDCLVRSNFSEKEREENSSVKEITEEYTKTFSSYVAGIYYRLAEVLGEDMIIPLSAPCYRLGYDGIQEKIFIYKTCPKA